MVTRSRMKRSGSGRKKPTRLKKYKAWFVIRDGGFSAMEAIRDIQNQFDIDDYTTRPSFVSIEKRFSNKKDAKAYIDRMSKALWNYGWYKQADCGASGVSVREVMGGKEYWSDIGEE